MFLLEILKSFAYNPVYRNFYPLRDIENICEKFNNWEFTEDEEQYVETIFNYLKMEIHDNTISELEEERNLSRVYKQKNKRIKDKDGKKYKEKIQVVKSGKEEKEREYKYNIEQRESKISIIKKVIKDIEESCVDKDDIEVMDYVIKSHKLSAKYQIFVTVLTIGIIVFFIIKKVFGI